MPSGTIAPSIFAIKSPAPPSPSTQQTTQKTAIAITSIAGGTGKTTLAANLGRILSSQGENVLLVDASGNGLLPFYFGAGDLRPGMRTFVSPEPGALPIHVLGAETVTPEWLENEVKPAMRTVQRTIFDLGPASFNLRPEICSLCAVRLIPLVVDLNSILSIPRIEAGIAFTEEQQKLDFPHPTYVLNKYDEASEREREGRDLITRQVGDRLLPIAIRRSPYVTEAISQRMTVVDYAFDSKITEDLTQLALWLKQAAPLAQSVAKPAMRWSEA
jgi:cellulose biosynthesis protein BcsQ